MPEEAEEDARKGAAPSLEPHPFVSFETFVTFVLKNYFDFFGAAFKFTMIAGACLSRRQS